MHSCRIPLRRKRFWPNICYLARNEPLQRLLSLWESGSLLRSWKTSANVGFRMSRTFVQAAPLTRHESNPAKWQLTKTFPSIEVARLAQMKAWTCTRLEVFAATISGGHQHYSDSGVCARQRCFQYLPIRPSDPGTPGLPVFSCYTRLSHPLLDAEALKVQRALPKLQGIGNGTIFFCFSAARCCWFRVHLKAHCTKHHMCEGDANEECAWA